VCGMRGNDLMLLSAQLNGEEGRVKQREREGKADLLFKDYARRGQKRINDRLKEGAPDGYPGILYGTYKREESCRGTRGTKAL